jgi:hypothetical protein|tara:strand:+ start:3591 stop:3821 length:231 start_codon:yes stop_codon:yes gene_type:complete
MQSLEDYAKENPNKSRLSEMEHPELKGMVDEAVQGIRNGIEPTVSAKWFVEHSPVKLTIKHDTVRQWLYDKARERI